MNCPDISRSKLWFPDKNNLFACLGTTSASACFPTDPKYINAENIELENLLAEIKSIMNRADFNYLYIDGDINCDFTRNTIPVGLI